MREPAAGVEKAKGAEVWSGRRDRPLVPRKGQFPGQQPAWGWSTHLGRPPLGVSQSSCSSGGRCQDPLPDAPGVCQLASKSFISYCVISPLEMWRLIGHSLVLEAHTVWWEDVRWEGDFCKWDGDLGRGNCRPEWAPLPVSAGSLENALRAGTEELVS